MFSHELFDFASTGNLADAHVDALDPYHDSLFDSFIDTSYVDQSFCSDFACCGQKLPDLHRLLEHFEEEHVLPLSSDARPLFSSPVYAQPRSADLAPYASYILSYPQPDPPLQAVAHSMSATSGPSSPSLQFDGMPPVPDLTHTPLSPSPTASSATSAHSSPGPAEPICLPPSLFSVQPSPPSRSRSRRDRPRARDASDTDVDTNDTDEEEAPADGEFEFEFEDAPPARPGPTSKLSSLSGNAVGPGPHRRAKKTCSAARMDPVSASGLAARARAAERERERASFTSPATPKRRDGREKAYKCPVSAPVGFCALLSPCAPVPWGRRELSPEFEIEILGSVNVPQGVEIARACARFAVPASASLFALAVALLRALTGDCSPVQRSGSRTRSGSPGMGRQRAESGGDDGKRCLSGVSFADGCRRRRETRARYWY